MKHFIYLAFATCFVLTANAQTEKGNFLIGGSASFQRATTDNSTNTSFSLSPGISYFFADRFAVGLLTPLNTSDGSTGTSIMSSSTSYAIGPTLRYYFPIAEQWAIFPEVDYYHQWSNSHTVFLGLPADSKSTSNVFRLNLGVTYFIARNVGLEGIVYYQNTNTESSLPSLANSGPAYGIRFGLQIYLLRGSEESK